MKEERKSQNTSKTERTDVDFYMWRKKVDNTLLRHNSTPIPNWLVSRWKLEGFFPLDKDGKLKKKNTNSKTKIEFNKKIYDNSFLTCTHGPKRPNRKFELHIPFELSHELKNVFLMSYMRELESGLRGNVNDLETEIPFWEFVDIEFNHKNKIFRFTAHYTHTPMFPELFKNFAKSPVLKVVEDQITIKDGFRIHKQDWKPKEQLETEIGAFNVVYTLIDEKNKLIYVGEAEDLKKRLKGNYDSIPNWSHYRYDVLPKVSLPKVSSKEIRVSIERMVIRSYASLLKNKSNIESMKISTYRLANDKIDK